MYTLPDFEYQTSLCAHRAAVNAVSITPSLIASASGDRSIRLWDAKTGKLLRTFENHHTRGIASIDFKPPYLLSGSSDKHLRLSDISSNQLPGWSTSSEPQHQSQPQSDTGSSSSPIIVCSACGSPNVTPPSSSSSLSTSSAHSNMRHTVSASPHSPHQPRQQQQQHLPRTPHCDLVRSVALTSEFCISASYDTSVKVWDRQTGALVADLANGHTGRVFCVGADCTKVVSCGEDQRICIWDFGAGLDTSFVEV